MDETTRDVIARWKRDFPMTHERPSTTVELANQLRAARDAEMESELWAQVDELELTLAQRRDVADAVELAQPVESSTFGTDAVATAALVNKAVDLHGAAVEAALDGDQAALSAALQAHADALRALAVSAPSSADTSFDPSQPRSVSRPATPAHPLITSQPLPTTDARQGRGVAGTFPLVGGQLPTGYVPD